ncbi:MAG: hypothetical protein V4736_12205 [Bdellovibrionota bacterium]
MQNPKVKVDYRRFIRNQRGLSVVEVIIALGMLVCFAAMFLPFLSDQRKQVNSYGSLDLCRGALARTLERIDASGGYELPRAADVPLQGSGGFVPSPAPPIYNAATFANVQAVRSSLNPRNTKTFANRFTQFGVTRLYEEVIPGATYTLDGNPITTDQDGIILYTPFLAQGAMADLAEYYDGPFRAAPSPIPVELQDPVANPPVPQMQINRFRLTDASTTLSDAAAGVKFWPVPRNQFSTPNPALPIEIRNPAHPSLVAQGKGEGLRIARFPPAPIEMTWDYGFLVTLSLTNFGPDLVNCTMAKEFRFPTAFHNVSSYITDFKVTDPTGTKNLNGPNTSTAGYVDTHNLSNKWDDIIPLGPAVTKIETIFTNKSVVVSDGATDRPKCSQDGTINVGGGTPPLTFRLRFRNLGKSPGQIPMCLDASTTPPGLRNVDGSDYIWCPGGVNAEVRIVGYNNGGARALSQGWVPCESLKFCHETPVAVSVTSPAPGELDYEYQYNFTNGTNAAGSKLWGCLAQVETAMLDAMGNLTYIPGAAVNPISGVAVAGVARQWGGGVTPFVYFKPPPCFTCKCKPCKGGGSGGLFGILFLGFLVLVAVLAPYLAPGLLSSLGAGFASASTALMGTLGGGALMSIGGIGTLLSGVLLGGAMLCAVNNATSNGGSCGAAAPLNSGGSDYRHCLDSPGTCSCGHTCNRINPPDPYRGVVDSPTGFTVIPQPFCKYETRNIVSTVGAATVNWTVQIGLKSGTTGVAGVCINDYDASLGSPMDASKQADIGALASWSMVDESNGFFCAASYSCQIDATGNGQWITEIDPQYGTIEGCVQTKLAHVLSEASPGGPVSSGPSVCQYPEIDTAPLWGTADFDCKAYNGAGVWDRANLSPTFTAGAGTVTGMFGRSGGTANAPTFGTPYGAFFPVRYSVPNCAGSDIFVGGAPGASGPTPVGSIYSIDCPGVAVPCPLSCGPGGGSPTCNPNTDGAGVPMGSCPGAVLDPVPPPPPPPAIPPPPPPPSWSCPAGTPAMCFQYPPFQSWNSCTPPTPGTMEYVIPPSGGMFAFDVWDGSGVGKPMCPHSSLASSSMGTAADVTRTGMGDTINTPICP